MTTSGDAPDIAGACLDCRTVFLLPFAPADPGIAGGLAPAGLCPGCGGVVVAVDAAGRRLADLIVVLRDAGSLHFSTLLLLVESWRVVPPSPLAALAELGPVAPDVLEVFDTGAVTATARRAIGALLVLLLPDLVRVAASHADPDEAAHALLTAAVNPGAPIPLSA